MSRIGIQPIKVPTGVEVTIGGSSIKVAGSLGTLEVILPKDVTAQLKNETLVVERQADTNTARMLHGTWRALLANLVTGVSVGFTKKLELVGLGYRAALEGDSLVLQVGFTHPVKLPIPDGLKVAIEKNVVAISGIDKQQVGQFAAVIRAVRSPEPYKGKGIRYQGELIRLKQGKATKGAAS